MSEPDTVYCYPPHFTVRNRFGTREQDELDAAERAFVAQRWREAAPVGTFDLAHLRALHRHLFQDVYEWAGELRTVEISKEGHQFQFRRYIENGMADVHRRLVARDFLKGLDAAHLAGEGDFMKRPGMVALLSYLDASRMSVSS